MLVNINLYSLLFLKLIYTFNKLLKLFIIFSAVIASWTSIALITSTTFDLEIKELVTKMYMNQKNFIYNIKDLSILLMKDANQRFSEE